MQTSPSDPILRLEQVSLASSIGRPAKPNEPLPAGNYLLRDLSFSVFPGDRIAVIGASGAGKTSLFRLLNRLSEPTSGSIYLGNQEFRQMPPIELRQQIVLVLQESKLLGMTVQQALEYPLRLRKLPPHQIRERVSFWMERFHLPSDWLERNELQLSVGQRQWVAIVRALLLQPKVLLLDEPTSALDVGRSQVLLDGLLELSRNNEMTILMANHQLEFAEQFCDRVLYLQQGQLLRDCASNQVDWQDLQQTLIHTEMAQAQEWE